MCGHEHKHHHVETAVSREELTALLEFTVKHNVSHTGELEDLADKVKNIGCPDAAGMILSALEEYDKGNEFIKEALEAVKQRSE